MKNKYIIGDIHGCIKSLKELYYKIEKDSDIYCLGDLIDKGPNSAEVIDFVIEKNIICIKGNHEFFFEHYMSLYLNGETIEDSKWYKIWGGDTTIKSYKSYSVEKIKKHLEFIRNLPLYREIDIKDENGRTAFLSHGFALPYYKNITEIIKDDSRSIYSNRLNGKYFNTSRDLYLLKDLGVVNIFGHDAFKDVQYNELYIGIDTGCAYGKTESKGGKLSMIKWPSKEIISVNSLDNSNYIYNDLILI